MALRTSFGKPLPAASSWGSVKQQTSNQNQEIEPSLPLSFRPRHLTSTQM
jgi:hypothetical protein